MYVLMATCAADAVSPSHERTLVPQKEASIVAYKWQFCVGEKLGVRVRTPERVVGTLVGATVGETVGECDGKGVVGERVGAGVGKGVGKGVG
jgi:hypothetical protein